MLRERSDFGAPLVQYQQKQGGLLAMHAVWKGSVVSWLAPAVAQHHALIRSFPSLWNGERMGNTNQAQLMG